MEEIKNYDDMGELALDMVREVGSIGTGNAATAVSSLLKSNVKISLPDVKILDFNEAVDVMGSPEELVAAVLVQMSGDINGIMLFLMRIDFIDTVLESMLGKRVTQYSDLDEMDMSALTEVGNIIIASYVNALSGLSGMEIDLSVPAVSVNMLGGILSVPMIELGLETDKIMINLGKFILEEKQLDSSLFMLPDIPSLNNLFKKLVAIDV